MANAVEVFRQGMEARESEYRELLPEQVNVRKFTKTAVTAVVRNPGLLQADQKSLFFAIREAAALGLDIGGIQGEGYLIVRNSRNGKQVQFQPGYRGLIKLARNSGEISTIDAGIIYENDHVLYQRGTEPKFSVTPNWKDPGEPVGAFACAVMKDGGYQFKVMSKAEVEKIRKRSGSPDRGPWATDWEAMATKTAIRQLVKLLPFSASDERTAKAIDLEEDEYETQPEKDVTPEKKALPAPAKKTRKKKVEDVKSELDALADEVEAQDVPPPEEDATQDDAPPANETDYDPDTGEILDGEVMGDADEIPFDLQEEDQT